MQIFHKKKFLQLDLKQQHKKCAELLRCIYESFLFKKDPNKFFQHYNNLSSWLKLNSFSSTNLKEIADRYHFHLKLANINLKEHNLLPTLRKNDGNNKEKPFLNNAVYLDNVRSAYNVGSILRTTEALRFGSIYFSKNTPYVDNNKIQKTSMGAYSIVKCYQDFNLEDLPRPFIGLDTSEKSTSIYDFIFPKQFTIVLGNEEYGICDEMLKELDYLIEIPMLGFKNSINIACAYSIAANELRRQLNYSLSAST